MAALPDALSLCGGIGTCDWWVGAEDFAFAPAGLLPVLAPRKTPLIARDFAATCAFNSARFSSFLPSSRSQKEGSSTSSAVAFVILRTLSSSVMDSCRLASCKNLRIAVAVERPTAGEGFRVWGSGELNSSLKKVLFVIVPYYFGDLQGPPIWRTTHLGFRGLGFEAFGV